MTRRPFRALTLVLTIVVSGGGGGAAAGAALELAEARERETPTTGADEIEALEADLERAERAFAGAAADRDEKAFRSFLTPQTVFATPHGNLRGPEAILGQWAGFFAPEGPSIGWEPQRVAVVEDGTVGLTSGPFWIEALAPEGGTTRYTGTFFSVWRRDGDGRWKILLDTGTEARPE